METNSVSLSEHAAERIRGFILTGQIKPGEKLNVDGLARTLCTSKTPVREALNMLSAERLVVYRPKLGYSVLSLTVQEFIEANEIQEALELHIFTKLLEKKLPLDFEELESINGQIEKAVKTSDYMSVFSLNEEFHMAMYGKCGNRMLIKELRRVWNELLIHRYHMFTAPSFLSHIVQDHKNLMQAMKAGDLEKLRNALRLHFENGVIGVTEGLDVERDAI